MAELACPLESGAGSLGVFAFRSELMMNGSPTRDIEAWEDDGGAVPAAAVWLSGFAAQVEWAERIRCQVNAEFDRVAASFRSIASRQSPAKCAQRKRLPRSSRRSALR
jgi:hypothetical protein